jgi:hypothetical protein
MYYLIFSSLNLHDKRNDGDPVTATARWNVLDICASRDVVTWPNPHVLSSLVGLGLGVSFRLTLRGLLVEAGEQCFYECPTVASIQGGFQGDLEVS